MVWLAVMTGGALGSLARHVVNGLFSQLIHRPVPYATAAVNLVGSGVIGILAGLLAAGRLHMSVPLRAAGSRPRSLPNQGHLRAARGICGTVGAQR